MRVSIGPAMLGGWPARVFAARASHILPALMFALFGAQSAFAVDLDKAAINIVLPDQIPWKDRPFMTGLKEAVLAGDPTKPGIYVVLVKWLPHNMSRPHFHPNDRFIKVISGTWWVGTGDKFDPDNTVPLPAGSFVTHYAKQVHYDGAKDEETVLEIVGEGPATSIPAAK
jgi:hypothetical protein